MIVRDESRCLARCLDSVVALVDEINIVDTGSVDATLDIARNYTQRISQIAWTGDFAAARNHSLDMASCDVVLVMDADEWLDDASRRCFREQVGRVRGVDRCGDVLILSPFQNPGDAAGTQHVSRVWIPRVFSMPVRYVGAIHEQPAGAREVTRLELTFNHDGYTSEQSARKGDRNIDILRDCLTRFGQDAYLRFQMGRELLRSRDVPGAVEEFTTAYRLSLPDAPYRLSVILALSDALNQASRYEQSLELLESELKAWGHSADLLFAIGTTLINLAPERAQDALTVILPMAIDSFNQCLEVGRRSPGLTEMVGVDSFHAARNLAIIYREAYGDAVKASHFEALERSLRAACAEPSA